MLLGLRIHDGGIWLVVDDRGVDVILDEWDRCGGELLHRDGVYDEWRKVGPKQLRQLRKRAQQARSERQQYPPPMQAIPRDL